MAEENSPKCLSSSPSQGRAQQPQRDHLLHDQGPRGREPLTVPRASAQFSPHYWYVLIIHIAIPLSVGLWQVPAVNLISKIPMFLNTPIQLSQCWGEVQACNPKGPRDQWYFFQHFWPIVGSTYKFKPKRIATWPCQVVTWAWSWEHKWVNCGLVQEYLSYILLGDKTAGTKDIINL